MTVKDLRQRTIDLRLGIAASFAFGVLVWAIDPPEFSWFRMILALGASFSAGFYVTLVSGCILLVTRAYKDRAPISAWGWFRAISILPGIASGTLFYLLAEPLSAIWRVLFALLVLGAMSFVGVVIALSVSCTLGIAE